MKRCETDGCDNDRARADVVLCPECWLAYQDFRRDAEREGVQELERLRVEVER
jgi:hypothetical protein